MNEKSIKYRKMKANFKKFSLLLFIISQMTNGALLNAQHCQYDHSRLVGVRPMTRWGNTVEGLKITLVDENGKPIIKSKDIYKGNDHYLRSEYDTVEFWRNPEPNSDKEHKNRNKQSRHFVQAFTDYICIVGDIDTSEHKTYIKIEDPNGRFKTQYIQLDNSKTQHLCGYPDERDYKSTYSAILIYMTEANPQFHKRKEIRKHPFTFYFAEGTNDLSPPQCTGCFYRHLQILNSEKETIGSFYLLCNQGKYSADGADSMQVADYNFDGYPDVRLFNFNLTQQKYYLYNPYKDTFEYEPLLSKLIHIYFDFNQKKAIGSYFDTDFKGRTYVFEGTNLTNLTIISNTKPMKLWQVNFDTGKMTLDTQVYHYHNYTLVNKKNTLNNSRVVKYFGTKEFNMNLSYELNSNQGQSYQFKKTINVKDLQSGKTLLDVSVWAGSVRNFCTDSLETADYNFDGYTDIRYCGENASKYIYYVFDKDSNKFIKEPFLNQLINLHFDHKNKILSGHIHQLDSSRKIATPGGFYYNTKYLKTYVFRGHSMKEVEEKVQTPDKSGKMKSVVNYYQYKNHHLELTEANVSPDKYNAINRQTIVRGKFKFVLEMNPSGMVLPAEKGAYGKRISVYKNNDLIYTGDFTGNRLKTNFRNSDSLQVADYNFDGFPDFRIPGQFNYLFYLYVKGKNTYEQEPTLSQMNNPSIDFERQTIVSEKQRLDKPNRLEPNETYYIFKQYFFKGPSLRNVRIVYDVYNDTHKVHQDFYYINYNFIPVKDKKQLKLAINTFSHKIDKTVGEFRFELTFNDYKFGLKDGDGKYAKSLRIYQKNETSPISDFKIYGDAEKEPDDLLDSLYIEDYNFDGYPDIRIYNSVDGNRYIFYLYNPEEGKFYYESRFSTLENIEFNSTNKTLSGIHKTNNSQTKWLLHLDTLFSWELPLSQKTPMRFIYKNGSLKSLPQLPYSNIIILKDTGDFNFDGYEDYKTRQPSISDKWDVFIYDSVQKIHVKDTFLSQLLYLYYDREKKTFGGTYKYYTDSSFLHYNSEHYEWINGKMTLIGYESCSHTTRFSERIDCAIFKLVDGVMIQVDFIHGAE
ncbi:MAG TPA: hypothetical protein VGF79_10165 [Bacteroidia bacterium]